MNQGYKSVPTGSKSMQESVLYHKKKKKKDGLIYNIQDLGKILYRKAELLSHCSKVSIFSLQPLQLRFGS